MSSKLCGQIHMAVLSCCAKDEMCKLNCGDTTIFSFSEIYYKFLLCNKPIISKTQTNSITQQNAYEEKA